MPQHNLPDKDTLVREMQRIEDVIRSKVTGQDQTALVRLVSDQDETNWPALLREHGLYQWVVCALGKERFPVLSQLLEQIDDLEEQKDHDPLTGLRNRRAFDHALGLEIERATRFQTPLSLALLDLDDFKQVNDTYGHPCGDKVLQKIASLLRAETRKIDITARYGGEEFAILLPGTGLMRAQKLLERIVLQTRTASVQCGASAVSITCSIGLASYRGKAAPDRATLIREADKALYRAKQAGKNRLESAPLLDLGPHRDTTLVQQSEKKFLFSAKS
ncbi:hypothetical protein MASR1M90_03900 [Desulfovibrionales bacterium]